MHILGLDFISVWRLKEKYKPYALRLKVIYLLQIPGVTWVKSSLLLASRLVASLNRYSRGVDSCYKYWKRKLIDPCERMLSGQQKTKSEITKETPQEKNSVYFSSHQYSWRWSSNILFQYINHPKGQVNGIYPFFFSIFKLTELQLNH